MPAEGERVQLLGLGPDGWTKLEPGALGTVGRTDDVGTMDVIWDDGHHLGLIPGVDSWRVISAREEELLKEAT